MKAQPCLPNVFLHVLKTKQKALKMIPDQSSTIALLYDHERESFPQNIQWFRAQNGKSFFSLEKNKTYSQTVKKLNMLIFQSIDWFHLT